LAFYTEENDLSALSYFEAGDQERQRPGGENFQAFNKAQAREKCPLAPGLGARIAAEIIIESMEKEQSAPAN
jgi:hypothetical protein